MGECPPQAQPMSDDEKEFNQTWDKKCLCANKADMEMDFTLEGCAWKQMPIDVVKDDRITKRQAAVLTHRQNTQVSPEAIQKRLKRMANKMASRAKSNRPKFLTPRPDPVAITAPTKAFFEASVKVYTKEDVPEIAARHKQDEAQLMEKLDKIGAKSTIFQHVNGKLMTPPPKEFTFKSPEKQATVNAKMTKREEERIEKMAELRASRSLKQ